MHHLMGFKELAFGETYFYNDSLGTSTTARFTPPRISRPRPSGSAIVLKVTTTHALQAVIVESYSLGPDGTMLVTVERPERKPITSSSSRASNQRAPIVEEFHQVRSRLDSARSGFLLSFLTPGVKLVGVLPAFVASGVPLMIKRPVIPIPRSLWRACMRFLHTAGLGGEPFSAHESHESALRRSAEVQSLKGQPAKWRL